MEKDNFMEDILNNFDRIDDILIEHVKNIEKLKNNINSFEYNIHNFDSSTDLIDFMSSNKLEIFKLKNSYFRLFDNINNFYGLKKEVQNLKHNIIKNYDKLLNDTTKYEY